MWGTFLLLASQSLVVARAMVVTPDHLRPGSLVGHVGEVELVKDSLWVEYPYRKLLTVPWKLRAVVEALNATAWRFPAVWRFQQSGKSASSAERVPVAFSSESSKSFPYLETRIAFVRDSLTEVLDNYGDIPDSVTSRHHRSKRGLLNIVGRVAQTLFGTALDKDVQQINLRNRELELRVRLNANSIQLANDRVSKVVSRVDQLTNITGQLVDTVNTVSEVIDWAVVAIHIDQRLTLLESVTTNLVHTNRIILENLVDASRGRVTSSLFPLSDLREALRLGRTNYSLTPVYGEELVQHYYTLLDSFVGAE